MAARWTGSISGLGERDDRCLLGLEAAVCPALGAVSSPEVRLNSPLSPPVTTQHTQLLSKYQIVKNQQRHLWFQGQEFCHCFRSSFLFGTDEGHSCHKIFEQTYNILVDLEYIEVKYDIILCI